MHLLYFETILFCAIAVLVFQGFLFMLAVAKNNNGIADIGWGMGFIIIVLVSGFIHFCVETFGATLDAVATAHMPGFDDFNVYLVYALVVVWAIRLSFYLLIRNRHKPEDWRYARWRQDWGKLFYVRSFFQVFFLQAF